MEKICRICKESRPLEKFSKVYKDREDRVSACTRCRTRQIKKNFTPERLFEFKENEKVRQREWRDNILLLPDNNKRKINYLEKTRKIANNNYIKNREKYLNRNKTDKVKEYVKQWYKKNKERELIKSSKRYMERKIKNPFRTNYSNYCAREKSRGGIFFMSFDEFKLYIEQDCFYCGKLLSGGIDRIDNNFGYSKENTVPCCKTCNYMKNKTPIEEFIKNCKKIAGLHS